jgi:hypothetical protein
MRRSSWPQRIAEAAASKKERTRLLLAQMKERQAHANSAELPPTKSAMPELACTSPPVSTDRDFTVLKAGPNHDLAHFVDLLDHVALSDHTLHAALVWPHIPPRAILPWMLREVSRGRAGQPMRTLFLNMGRPALQAVAGIEVLTEKLRARGIVRSGADGGTVPRFIGPDAHFYMFLGDTRDSAITSVPLISIVPHAVALNDGTFWRDFDEKTLKGFKRLYPSARLNSIRKHLSVLSSAERSPAFAFLLPSHFPEADRKQALRSIPGVIDLAIVDMMTHALRSRDASTLIRTLVSELEERLQSPPKHVLVLTDCPLRFSFIRRSLTTRHDSGSFGTKVESHRLIWSTRGLGFEVQQPRHEASRPVVETIASRECLVATRLWKHAKELDEASPLAPVLDQGAVALKGMGLTASGADAILAPYTDVHDTYHRVKRERHSFEPHYNKATALVGEGHAGQWRDAIQSDLAEGLALATALRTETPLMRYLKRVLTEIDPHNDVVVVLRHPEDAQQANDRLLDFLTEPGSFLAGIPELRVTTPSHYSSEVERKPPTVVIWAASAILGARAYIGDAYCPSQFRLVVAGQDALTLNRILSASLPAVEYAAYSERTDLLLKALPWVPKEFGGLSAALGLDADRPRVALPFTGQGYLLLDGYGKIAAGPGSQFYVLDPVSHQLAPREARSIDVGDAVFVMPDAIREEIEAVLREKDEKGRTLEQALVDQYKATVKKGIDALSEKYGKKALSARVHDMLFQQNPELPSISKQGVEYWLRAAERSEVDTPHAAINPVHIEAFLRLMGAGVLARPLTDAVRIVRSDLRREGHTNRGLFDRLLLDADSLIQGPHSSFEKLRGIRRVAMESVFPVLEKHTESAVADVRSLERVAQ